MPDKLEPDQESLDKWKAMPQSPPSKQALPPIVSGVPTWLVALIILAGIIIVLGLLQT